MHLPQQHLVLKRRALVVLAAWWCVLLAAGVAPWMQGQAGAAPAVVIPVMERLCSGSDGEQWVPSAFGAVQSHPHSAFGTGTDAVSNAGGAHHMLECALCLPTLAGGSSAVAPEVAHWPQVQAQCCAQAQRSAAAADLPPARGPPFA